MKILFMGTPDFAVSSLDAIVKSGHTVVGVITQPDKPKGRGHKMSHPPVYEYAVENNLDVYQPETLKNNGIANILEDTNPDLIVVVAYGKILPEYILNYPKHGCVNVHGSLLPKYRGAAPIQRSIIDGESVTGVTTMYMEKGLDTGDMIEKTEVEITDEDNFETLHDKLASAGAKLIVSTITAIENNTVVREKQDDTLSTYAEMITKETSRIDWDKSAKDICNLIRGLYPVPKAFTFVGDTQLKIGSARIAEITVDSVPGTVIKIEDAYIRVACGMGTAVDILEIQPAGKRMMTVGEYLRGNALESGIKFDF